MDKDFGRAAGTEPKPLPKRRPIGRPATNLPELKDRASMVKSAREHGLISKPRFIPDDVEKQNHLGQELLLWAEESEALSIDEFFLKKKIAPSIFYRSARGNPYLNSCLETALCAVAQRLGDKIRDNQLYLMNAFKNYDSRYLEEARVKREADQEQKVITTYKEEIIGIPVFTRGDK